MRLDIPTRLSPAEVDELRRLSRGRRVVEGGSLLGFSTVVLAQEAAIVHAIDKHAGYSAPTLGPFLRNLERYRIQGRVAVWVADVLDVLPALPSDFTFLDLTGGRELTREALARCSSPVVAVHDFGRPRCDGVREAIEAQERYKLLHVVDTLAVLERSEH